MTFLCMVKFILFAILLPEAAGTTLRTRGDDGGDDGGSGGLAGALSGMMGGGGGDGGPDDGDDDDANMVGGHKKKKKAADGGVDLGGLEKGLQSGGVNQLTMMLKAMRAAQSPSMQHIVKGDNGEEMYDFRDLDDGPTTTMVQIQMTERPTAAPAPLQELPTGPSIKMDANGKMIGLASAEAQVKAEVAKAKSAPASGGTKGKKLVAWGGKAAPQPQPQAAQPMVASEPHLLPAAAQPLAQPTAMVSATPPVLMTQPAAMTMPMMMAAPSVPMTQMNAAPGDGASALYQGLAMLNQNMNTLMREAADLKNNANNGPLAKKVDETSQNFLSYENTMEKRVKGLEDENNVMRKQMNEQAQEIKEMEQEVATKQAVVSDPPKAVTKTQGLRGQAPKGESSAPQDAKSPTNTSALIKTASAVKVPAAKASKNASDAVKTATTTSVTSYATAPWDATFSVHVDAKAGGKMQDFTIRVHPEWAPEGAKRFQDILQAGILQDARFFRVVPGFMVQWGIPGSPKVAAKWAHKRIQDDPVIKSNSRGMVTFASSGKNSRTTQMFVNYANNEFLDKQGFSPFAEVLDDGMKVVDGLQAKYKEKPNQGKIQHHGNKYLMKHFPELSFVDHVASTLGSVPAPATGA